MANTRVYLTASAVVYQSYTHGCGCCAYSQARKTVPLEKIQDVSLQSGCCADCCGFNPKGTSTYAFAIETAGSATPGPEVVVIALSNPEELRNKVLAARRIHSGRGTAADHAALDMTTGASPGQGGVGGGMEMAPMGGGGSAAFGAGKGGVGGGGVGD